MCLRRQCVPRVSFHNRSRTLINASMIMGLDLSRLFLVSHFIYFLFIPCGRLSWLPVSLLLHFKYTLSYRIVSYRKNYRAEDRARSYDASAGACVSWTRETSGQTTGRATGHGENIIASATHGLRRKACAHK